MSDDAKLAAAEKQALIIWGVVGVAGTIWLAVAPLPVPLAVWISGVGSWALLAVAMLGRWRNSYGYAMLMAILYTVAGTMDIVAYGAAARAAIAFTAITLLAFFALIPATRMTRRRDTRE
ncbi:MAG: hypothetical protein AAFZ58_16315 [Pseudomonadota bacterium]